jgi:hypothetical protein
MDTRQVVETPKARVKSRLLYLDNLKVFLIVLVIAHHASLPYGYYNAGWPVHEPYVSDICAQVLSWFTSVNGAFFMGLFFLVSAYFLPASFDRKGAAKYVKDRLLRLGLPIPITGTSRARQARASSVSAPSVGRSRAPAAPHGPPPSSMSPSAMTSAGGNAALPVNGR